MIPEQAHIKCPGIRLELTCPCFNSCVVVKALTESFQRADTDRDGWLQLSYEQFMQMALEVC